MKTYKLLFSILQEGYVCSKTVEHDACGVELQVGEIMVNANMAATLRTLAKEGKDGFYKGRIVGPLEDLRLYLLYIYYMGV